MRLTIDVSNNRLRELISEAGSRYWAKDFRWVKQKAGLSFRLVEHGDVEETPHFITATKLRDGLQAMAQADANEGGWHFANVLNTDSSDMWTGDAIIQFACFGELKYG